MFSPQSSCQDKTAFKTTRLANHFLKRQKSRAYLWTHVYKCSYCTGSHIGHIPLGRQVRTMISHA